MLTFVTGEAGSGKTEFIYEKVCGVTSDAILFVPDQFVFETEKLVAEKTGEKAGCIKIGGFSSLSEEILKKHLPRKNYADNAAKLIVMLSCIKALRPSLRYYGKAASKSSFANLCLDTVCEFKQSGITPDMVLDACQKTDGVFADKLFDLSLIYMQYSLRLADIYDDRQDNLLLAARAAEENDCFAGCTVFIDGFDSFSGSQLKFLEPIIRQSDNCFAALRTSRGGEMCFEAQEKTIRQLSAFAEKENSEIEYIHLDAAGRYDSAALAHLRNQLPKDAPEVYDGVNEDIELAFAPDITTECDFVCAKIKKAVSDGMRYSDITVLCSKPVAYAGAMQSAALRYDIPLFADIPVPISEKPLLKYIGFLLNAAEEPTGANVIRYIKSGFVRIPREGGGTVPITLSQIHALDEYCNYWDIKSRSFAKPFSHTETEKEKELEEIRKAVVTPLIKLKKECSALDGAGITKALTRFLFETADIKAAIQGKCQDYTTRKLRYDKLLTEEYNQLWSYVSQLLTCAYETMQGSEMTLAEYASVLSMCAMQINLSKPPQVLDSVLFGDTGRTRSAGAKAVFVMGADIESFPDSKASETQVFTEKEYAALCENGIDLRQSCDELYALQLADVYKALTLASRKLCVSWCGNGENAADSVTAIRTMFADAQTTDISRLPAAFFCESIGSARKQMSRNYFSADVAPDIAAALKSSGDNEYLRLCGRAAGRFADDSDIHDIQDTAQLIFGSGTLSPTAIDKLNMCRFDYFCRYGLKLREPASTRLDSANLGNIVHYIMNYVFEKLYTGGKNTRHSEETLSAFIAEAMEQYRKEFLMDEQEHSARFNTLFGSIARLSLTLLSYMTEELANSAFSPRYFELKLAPGKETADGFRARPFQLEVQSADGKTHTINISGTVDRVDIAQTAQGKEIRVIDYKTGKKDFSLSKVYYGLDLQLLLYLFTLCEANEDYIPSAATYYPGSGTLPMKNVKDPSPELMRGIWLGEHLEKGIAVEGTQAAKEKENYNAVVLGSTGKITEKNLFAANEITAENLAGLKNRVKKIVGCNMGKVLSGDVSAKPLMEKDELISCTYCRFSSVCGRKEHNAQNINDNASAEFINTITKSDTGKDGE